MSTLLRPNYRAEASSPPYRSATHVESTSWRLMLMGFGQLLFSVRPAKREKLSGSLMRRSRALQRQTTTTSSSFLGAPMSAPHSTLFQVIKWPRRFAKTITGGWQPRDVRVNNTKITPSANSETLMERTWSVGTCSGLNSPKPSPRLTILRRANPDRAQGVRTRRQTKGVH